MARDTTEVISTIVCAFTRISLKLSTQCVDNPGNCYRGHTIEHYYRLEIKLPVTGTKKKPSNRLGVSALCNEIFLHSIITVCFRHRNRNL